MSRNHVELDTELAVELPFVVADPVLLQQVLLNLIMNAIEAMSSVNDRPRKLTILSQRLEAPAAVQVIVRDNGIGLDAVNSDRVFDTFYTSKPQGMGMGLSILPHHHCGAWRTANGNREYRARRLVSVPAPGWSKGAQGINLRTVSTAGGNAGGGFRNRR